MPATLTTTPPAIAFSRNPVPIVVTSPEGDYLAAAAANSVNFLQFTSAIAEDTVFVLSWGTGTATMTAKDAPDDSGLQFPTGDGSNDYVTGLLEWFAGNPFLSRDFDITADTGGAHPQLIFTAKLPGPDYDITTENGGASGNTTPGITNQPVANFAHHIESWIKTGSAAAFAQAYSCNVPLDGLGTGASSLEIQYDLDGFLSPDVPVMTAPYAQCLSSIGQYYLKTAHYKGDDPSIRKITTSDVFYIAKGGVGMPYLSRTMIQELCPGDPAQNRFLRQGSKSRIVTAAQPEWLTFINLTGASVNFNLEITVYNRDTSTYQFSPLDAAIAIAPCEKYQFITGYGQLNISGRQIFNKVPLYYTVRAKNGAAYISDIYTYVLDYTWYQWPRYIIYENSYGAFQTLATVGKGQPEYDRLSDQAQLAVGRSTAARTGEFIEVNIMLQEKATVNIGYARSNPRTTALLRDLLLSEANYLYDNGRLIPIGFNTKNLKDAVDGTNVYANTLEYYYKYNEQTWTEAAGLPDDDITGLLGDANSPATGEGSDGILLPGDGDSDSTTDSFDAIWDDDSNDIIIDA